MAGADTGVPELPYQAGGAITKNRFVKLSGDQTVVQTALSTDRTLGVAKVDISAAEATSGKGTAVQILGVAWVEAGATVTRSDIVMSDTSGRAITRTATNVPTGLCLKGGAVGEWILVLLIPSLPTA